jgi:Holliday junction DNA helicase RuvB
MFSMDPKKPAVLFIDEIHRMPMVVEETLYEALEDGTLSVIVGSSNDARSVTLRLPPLVIVGATTKPGALSQPLRDRFGFNAATAPYTDEELAEIVLREWTRNGRESADGAALVVGQRAKGVPRLALHLASRVMDVTAIEHTEITAETAERALEAFGVGRDGLDELDWRVLTALCVTFSGRAVGLDALAQALDVDQHTISATCEGNLVRKGLMMRTKGGRQAAPAAYELVRGMSA